MAKRTKNSAPPFTEAQARTWLSWLARGMQTHGQTVFMLEQLQPSWLATSYERTAYTLCSRLMVGLLYGLIFGVAFWCFWNSIVVIIGTLWIGFIFGLSLGFLDVSRLGRGRQTARPATPTVLQRWRSVGTVGEILILAYGVSCCAGLVSDCVVSDLPVPMNSVSNDLEDTGWDATLYVFALSFVLFLPILSITWGIRSSQRTLACDIQSVETLTWSWKAGATGCVPWLIFGLVIGIVFGFAMGEVIGSAIIFMFLAAVPGFLFAAIAALRPGVREMKTVANQGIRLSMRCAIYGGLVVGLIAGPIFGLHAILWRFIGNAGVSTGGPSGWAHFESALVDSSVFGLAVALLAGFWFGGLDVLHHYVLRLTLLLCGHTPFNYVRFLDHATGEFNFLQRVGGGYIFIHRMLLEHFADMQDEGKSNAQDTPALVAPTPFESPVHRIEVGPK